MNLIDSPVKIEKIICPEGDGKPMADNSKQFRWLTTIAGNRVVFLAEHIKDDV